MSAVAHPAVTEMHCRLDCMLSRLEPSGQKLSAVLDLGRGQPDAFVVGFFDVLTLLQIDFAPASIASAHSWSWGRTTEMCGESPKHRGR